MKLKPGKSSKKPFLRFTGSVVFVSTFHNENDAGEWQWNLIFFVLVSTFSKWTDFKRDFLLEKNGMRVHAGAYEVTINTSESKFVMIIASSARCFENVSLS